MIEPSALRTAKAFRFGIDGLETLLMALVWIMMIAIMNSNQMQVTMIIPLRVKTKAPTFG
jgi:hypothetical protein